MPYGHVDGMGFVYHPRYLQYFEMGRTEMLREDGLPYAEVEASGTLLVVFETGVRHYAPAHYDELLTVETRVDWLRGVRMRLAYRVLRDETLLAEGHTVLVSTDRGGRPCRPPEAVLASMRRWLPESARAEARGASKPSSVETP